MKTVRKAYHHLLLPDGTRTAAAVVVEDTQGNVLSWHPLQGEEPFTEWVGGERALSVES